MLTYSYIIPSVKLKESKMKKVKANEHDSYGTFTILALLFPIVGLIIGIVFLTKDSQLDRKVGEHTIVMSIIGFVVGWILLSLLFMPAAFYPAGY
jgi:uncharacterized membrane protein HdeD (DUF308 family)